MRPLATIASPVSGEIKVYRDGASGLLTYTQGGYEQSAADRRGVSTASYIHALYGLVRQTASRDALVIGCGGGSLGTMLDRAGMKVTLVDIDPAAFELAKRYFALPANCTCRVADGSAYLERTRRRHGAIVLDAYDAARMPAHLSNEDFFKRVKDRLAPKGAFFVNAYVAGDDDPFARTLAARLARVWRSVRMLDLKGRINRNAILMAGEVETLAQPTLIEPPQVEATEIEQTLRLLRFVPLSKRRKR
jgi:spermidine synthase